MTVFSEAFSLAPALNLCGTGRQDCRDLHAWGPGVRPIYIIHHVLRGKGFLETRKMRFSISAGESFLICPYETVWYYPLATVFDRLQKIDIYRKNRAEAQGLLRAILGIYADGFPASAQSIPQENELLSTAIRLIRTNYHHSSFTADRLCQMLGVSRSTLYRIFQKELSAAPSRFLTDFRLRQAGQLLSGGSAVKTTALSCGFSDPFYFSRLFHKEMGISPSEYRKRHGKA